MRVFPLSHPCTLQTLNIRVFPRLPSVLQKVTIYLTTINLSKPLPITKLAYKTPRIANSINLLSTLQRDVPSYWCFPAERHASATDCQDCSTSLYGNYTVREGEGEVAQSCPTLCDPMDFSPPDSSVHGIFPGKSTGVGCHFLLQEIFSTQVSHTVGRRFTVWATREVFLGLYSHMFLLSLMIVSLNHLLFADSFYPFFWLSLKEGVFLCFKTCISFFKCHTQTIALSSGGGA